LKITLDELVRLKEFKQLFNLLVKNGWPHEEEKKDGLDSGEFNDSETF